MTHTPGPWKVSIADEQGRFCILADNKIAICKTFEPNQSMMVWKGAPAPLANANLIAAAPELLATLKDAERDIVQCLHDAKWTPAKINNDPRVIKYRAAISKAEGK